MALRGMSATNRLQLNPSRPFHFPSATKLHSRMLQNFWAGYSQYLSCGSCRKYKNTLSNGGLKSECRISTRHYGNQLRVTPHRLPDPWKCHMHFSTTTCDFRLKLLSCQLLNKRPYSPSRKNSIFEATYSNGLNRTVVAADEKEVHGHSLIELFRNSQRAELAAQALVSNDVVKVANTKDANKTITAKAANSGKKKKVKSNEDKRDQQDTENKKVNNADKKKVLSSGVGTRSGKAPRKKKSDSSPESADAKSNASLSKRDEAAESRRLEPLWPPSGKSVMVLESITKAKIIQKYLGDMFDVLPSYGHVRDLAGRAGSVRPREDFSMVWEVPASAWTHLKTIKVHLSGAQNLILATDPDREGEAIAWHLIEMLQQQDALSENINVARVVFHEITDAAIKDALTSPRNLDMDLVNAYLARRALDYLIGFSVSPLLWRKLPGCQSAGRVQSASLSLICDREMEIEQFKPQEYWTVEADFFRSDTSPSKNGTTFSSQLSHLDLKKLDSLSISSHEDAESIKTRLVSAKFSVLKSKKSTITRNPPMPYITSTLQLDSSSKLKFTAAYTMQLAQKLYEGVVLSDEQSLGLITYTRTDGLHVSDHAAKDIQSLIRERYGENFAPKDVRTYFKKVKNAQEAHEAIRPTSIRRLPSTLVGILDDDSLRLYTLIWTRAMACQMEAAVSDLVQVEIGNAVDMVLRSSASRINFLGYQAVYKDAEAGNIPQSGHEENDGNEDFEVLTALQPGEQLQLKNVRLDQHHTKPPARYSEGSLVKKLEELGIGRPSTYAPILKVLQDREYVTVKSRVLYPEFRGRMVSAFLSHYFAEVSDYSFTADMENELDNVSAGMTEWKELLKDYWSRFTMYCDLASNIHVRKIEKMLEKQFEHVLFKSLPNSRRTCPSCSEGTLVFKVSRFGTGYFIGCDQHPNCRYIAETVVTESGDDDLDEIPLKPDSCFQPKLLGHHPSSNEKVFLKKGPFGYYVQLGDDKKESSPKRTPLAKVKDIDSFSFEDAVELLRYPIKLGDHPKDEQPVMLTHSRYGFSIRHKSTIAMVPKSNDPKAITLEIGLELLSSKKTKHTGRAKKKVKEGSLS